MDRSKIAMIVFAVASVMAMVAAHFVSILYTPASYTPETKLFMIERGTGFGTIASNLEKEGLIKNTYAVNLAAKIKKAHRYIQAGEYELNTGMTPIEIINNLKKGKTKKYSVTIPEGFRITEIAARLDANGLVTADEFIHYTLDSETPAKHGIDSSTVEGYLFPDTYLFSRGVTPKEIVTVMTRRFKQVYNELDPSGKGSKGLNKEEIVILASIIEKEAGTTAEMERISSVFRNRLGRNMKMQSCPTVIYDIKNFDGNLKLVHLRTDTPHNTYTRKGLPPGPIASPGKRALTAALNPSNENYLYFVSKNNGTHYFSKNLKEHNSAVNKFQKGMSWLTLENQ